MLSTSSYPNLTLRLQQRYILTVTVCIPPPSLALPLLRPRLSRPLQRKHAVPPQSEAIPLWRASRDRTIVSNSYSLSASSAKTSSLSGTTLCNILTLNTNTSTAAVFQMTPGFDQTCNFPDPASMSTPVSSCPKPANYSTPALPVSVYGTGAWYTDAW